LHNARYLGGNVPRNWMFESDVASTYEEVRTSLVALAYLVKRFMRLQVRSGFFEKKYGLLETLLFIIDFNGIFW
jgi:hypothetical protein